MKKILSLLGLVLTIFLTACAPGNDIEEATLSVSDSKLSFSASGGTQNITITTNQTRWVASSPQEFDWVTLEQEGTQLLVKVSPNVLGRVRQSTVLVNAGGATEKIVLTQAAGDELLNVSNPDVQIAAAGGTAVVDVANNVGSATIEGAEEAADWLTVSYDAAIGKLNLVAVPNPSALYREVQLFVKSGAKTEAVIVRQLGEQKFHVPLTKVRKSYEIPQRETQRGSTLVNWSPINPTDQNDVTEEYAFFTTSSYMPTMEYSVNPSKSSYVQCEYQSQQTTVFESDEFVGFMAQNGYVREAGGTSELTYYRNSVDQILASVAISYIDFKTTLIFTPYKAQSEPMSTFERLEFPGLQHLNVKTTKWTDIKVWEESQGYELRQTLYSREFEDQPYSVLFFNENKSPLLGRMYRIITSEDRRGNTDPAEIGFTPEIAFIYNDVSLALWQDPEEGKWYPTEEFARLLSREGFKFGREDPNGVRYYYSDEKGIVLSAVAYANKNFYNKMMLILEVYGLVPGSFAATSYQAVFNANGNAAKLAAINQQRDQLFNQIVAARKANQAALSRLVMPAR
ncbi:MAG: BACON domain-containing protein [Bacteroidaceae bacterium]|nr:BACON domain-containing protein [Bacteroidaceae bacterium]